MTHGLVDVLVVFDQDSLWPHVLFCPAVQKVKQSQIQNKPDTENRLITTRISTHMC